MLATLIPETLRRHGDRLAVSDDDTALTYRELDAEAGAAARHLAAALPAGDRLRVAVQAANSTAYVVLYLALLRLGHVPFLLDRANSPRETAAIAADCGLDALLHDAGVAAPEGAAPSGAVGGLALSAFTPPAERPPLHDTTEVCRFTSGSTGRPHCIEFSGAAVHRAAVNWVAGTGLTGEDRIACFASLSNGLAFNTSLLPAFLAGARLHLAHGLPTAGRVVRLLDRTGATRLVGFPVLYESLVRRSASDGAIGRLRMAISSAAPLPEEVGRRFTGLTGVPVQNYYGAAEAGPLTFARDPRRDPGLGQPLPGVSLRAGTPGDPAPVEVRSESMGTRYLNAPGLLEGRVTADGHYRTGDLGHLDGGSLVLTGRTSQVINVGGRKVDAVEVAAVLRAADGVRDAVVLEVTDRHGAAALGAVVAGAGVDPALVRRHAADLLAAHKVPALLRTVAEIPRGTTGKPAMAELRRLFTPARHDG
ncbi:class I adenylate-forming enzyme family protein [Saccharothrix syringae]|uniref:Long-chain fatty acid--CoA ligase n=1 Tax=Saccharothrix syringae TaxID=103733 RepID=A0A5Q0H057_SACSY|nr:class I adenylate-forming enzyme family protein [Saccharothrix syringae]QFZ19607.1 long-chain fatty acid--CoA ligase [Saccharothrix syringae]